MQSHTSGFIPIRFMREISWGKRMAALVASDGRSRETLSPAELICSPARSCSENPRIKLTIKTPASPLRTGTGLRQFDRAVGVDLQRSMVAN